MRLDADYINNENKKCEKFGLRIGEPKFGARIVDPKYDYGIREYQGELFNARLNGFFEIPCFSSIKDKTIE